MADRVLKGKMIDLVRLYKDHGRESAEFYDLCKNFIAYVQIRFMGSVDEDLQQTIYLRLMKSWAYYDEKTNIATWIFSVARHQVSSHNYHKKKRMKESEDGLELVEDKRDFMKALKDEDSWEEFLDSFHDMAIEPAFDLLGNLELLTHSNPILRAYIWKRLNLLIS